MSKLIKLFFILTTLLIIFVSCSGEANSPTENPNSPTENPNSPTENPNSPTENPNSPTENPNSPTENPTNANGTIKMSLNYMQKLMIDMDNITALGIRREETLHTNHNQSILSSRSAQDEGNEITTDQEPLYCLYAYSENYEPGSIECDSSSITKVTFKKNTSVTEDVYDNENNLIDSSTTITQDEIKAQINKLYTTKKFTFLQFIPVINSSGEYPYLDSTGEIKYETVNLRPNSMIYDENGVAEFDKTDYFSGNLTLSFVLDNNSGSIYKIEGLHIKGFLNGCIIDDNGYYYSISIDSDNNLIFTDLLPNKDVQVFNVYMTNDNWYYIFNNSIDLTDSLKKIVYTTKNDYITDSSGNIYTWAYYPNTSIKYLKGKIVDGIEISIDPSEFIHDLSGLGTTKGFYNNQLIGYECFGPNGMSIIYDRNDNYGLYIGNANGDTSYYWLDYDTVYSILDKKLYYLNIDYEKYSTEKSIVTISEDFQK